MGAILLRGHRPLRSERLVVEERRVLRSSHNYSNAPTGQRAIILFDQRPGTSQQATLQRRVNIQTSTDNLPTVNWFTFNVWSIYKRPRAIYQRPRAIYPRSIGLYFQRRVNLPHHGINFTTGSSFSVTRHSTNIDNTNN